MTLWMGLGVWNLRVIFIFGVYDEWGKKNLGVIKFFFWKFNVQKKIFPKILVQKFFFSFFQKKFKTNHVVGVKFEFRMTSAFIWCIYCLCRQKIMKFQNFVVSKLKFFVIKLGTFSRLVWKYYETYGCFQRLCGCLKISAFIWDHFWLIRVTNMHSTAHDICRAESAPPPNHTHTKKPELDRVKIQKVVSFSTK